MDYFHIWYKWWLAWGVSHVMTLTWPISSRSFDLDFENRGRSVTFSFVYRLFPHLPQIITTSSGCVACLLYNKILMFQFSDFFWFFGFHIEKRATILLAFFPYLAQINICIRGCVACNDLGPWPIFKVIQPWPWKSCPLCSVYSSGWIISIFGTNDH